MAALTKKDLEKRARKDLDAYDREFSKAEGGSLPKIIPRSEAIMRLREVLARELIRPAAKGFVFEGFKGVNNMTNEELSERLSSDPPVLDCIVWDDGDFQLLFGDWCQAEADDDVLNEMDLWAGGMGPRILEPNKTS